MTSTERLWKRKFITMPAPRLRKGCGGNLTLIRELDANRSRVTRFIGPLRERKPHLRFRFRRRLELRRTLCI